MTDEASSGIRGWGVSIWCKKVACWSLCIVNNFTFASCVCFLLRSRIVSRIREALVVRYLVDLIFLCAFFKNL